MSTLPVRHLAGVLNNIRILRSWQAVKTQRPITSEEEHRVLKFRPRTLAHPPGRRGHLGDQTEQDARGEPNDLSRYERDRDQPDDFRQRMLANVAAFAFTVALTAIGIGLAYRIAGRGKAQGR